MNALEHIKQSLDALAQGLLRGMAEDDRVLLGWQHVCGHQAAEHARAISFRNGRLNVDVDDPAWLASLTHLRAQYTTRLRTLTGVAVEHLDFVLAEKRLAK